jgi:hypothetical protein
MFDVVFSTTHPSGAVKLTFPFAACVDVAEGVDCVPAGPVAVPFEHAVKMNTKLTASAINFMLKFNRNWWPYRKSLATCKTKAIFAGKRHS